MSLLFTEKINALNEGKSQFVSANYSGFHKSQDTAAMTGRGHDALVVILIN